MKGLKKSLKRAMAAIIALTMVLSMGIAASAATTKDAEKGGDATITITLPEDENEKNEYTYRVYKVFDATSNGTSISYTKMEGKDGVPAGFSVDDAGNVTYANADATELTQDDIDAIAQYIAGDDYVVEVTAKVEDGEVIITGLEYGYYYITTTTGTVVTIDSTNPNANVKDKNEVPELNKKIVGASSYDDDGKKALAEVGSTVKFEATIDVKVGAEGYVFHDTMSEGLAYDAYSLNIYYIDADGNYETVNPSNYDTTTAEGDTLTVKFNDDFIKTVIGSQIVIRYNAVITEAAVTEDPEKNTATLDYGNGSTTNTTPESETEVYNAKLTVTKKDGNGAALAGAGFVIQNAEGKYYRIDERLDDDGNPAGNIVKWVEKIDEATEYISDADGNVKEFIGLANGVYTLIEKTVPAGYNKAADEEFTVAEHDYTAENLKQEAEVVNKAGSELPSTGGIGTTMFYVVGFALVLGAGVLLVTRKRMAK